MVFLQNKLQITNIILIVSRKTSAANHLPSFALRHRTSSISSGGGLQNVFIFPVNFPRSDRDRTGALSRLRVDAGAHRHRKHRRDDFYFEGLLQTFKNILFIFFYLSSDKVIRRLTHAVQFYL